MKNLTKRIITSFLVLAVFAGVFLMGENASASGGVSPNSPWANGFIVQTPYDQQVYVENGIEFHYVAGDTWQGMMMIIPDSSRVFVGMPKLNYDKGPGASAYSQAARYHALLAVNGAFFVDTNYKGNGGQPLGVVISQGRCTAGANTASTIIGLTANNIPVCGTYTGSQAVSLGVRDAVACSPILVQNGQMTNLAGQSRTLIDARTAVGFRADGSTLILSIDGRNAHSTGATTQMEAECFLAFGAICAGNLDGGGSCGLYYGGQTPINLINTRGGRAVPNSICVMP
ncbi:MAG: phosphodiester glycosidase family protein [Lachnospiraceae bacterium]|nr:phosphodiester glycosidase family protein [Lachnospiraceae bacterium]